MYGLLVLLIIVFVVGPSVEAYFHEDDAQKTVKRIHKELGL